MDIMKDLKMLFEGTEVKIIVNEKGEPFRKWVTSEVLPTMRKTGAYIMEGREEEMINNYFPSFSDDIKLAMVQDLLKQNKEYKEKVIKDVINSYEGIIPEPYYSKLKVAMYSYEVEMDD